MDRTALLNDVDAHDGTTYAEPLAGLRVSWGSILAGALGFAAVALILWALAAAIALSVTSATPAAINQTIVAMWISGMVTTLVGAFAGGWLAGYLPGNKSRAMGAIHGFLAWAVAFVVMTASGGGLVGGLARAITDAAELDTADSTLGGMQGGVVLTRMLAWMAGLTWAWFATWILAGVLAVIGGLVAVRQLRPRTRSVEPSPIPPATTNTTTTATTTERIVRGPMPQAM